MLRRSLLPVLAVGLFWTSGLQAQSAGGGQGQASQKSIRIDVDVPEGSLFEYVRSLKQQWPGKPLNVVIGNPALAEKIEIPSVKLHQVSLRTALEVIEGLVSSRDTRAKVRESGDRDSPIYFVELSEAITKTETVAFSMRRIWVGSGEPQLNGQESEAAFAERRKRYEQLRQHRLREVLLAFDFALDLSGLSSKETKIRFHEGSGLLFVRAEKEQLGVIRQVAESLINDDTPFPDEKRYVLPEVGGKNDASAEEIARLTKRIAKLEKQMQGLEALLKAARPSPGARRRAEK